MANTAAITRNPFFYTPERKKVWTCQTGIDNFNARAGITGLPYKRRHDKGVKESAPNGGWRFSPSLLAMIKQQSALQQRKKGGRRQIKMKDLPPKRNQKGGSSGKIVGSENGNSAIPTSLQEFLQRDSLSINSN